MNRQALAAAAMAVAVLAVQAEEQPTRFDVLAPESLGLKKDYIDWNDPRWWEAMRQKESGIAIGKSDFTADGPVVRTLRRAPNWSEKSLGEKIISLPVISLFVPQPINIAPRERNSPKLSDYFKWGDLDQPWSNLGDRPLGGPGLINVSY
ncbi:MAG TPA: hypothetical protein VK530_20525 [Candidatus Acidoferrum sp.]|nr:hypothetical protein [Candidatus Acidoferrum sp.]